MYYVTWIYIHGIYIQHLCVSSARTHHANKQCSCAMHKPTHKPTHTSMSPG